MGAVAFRFRTELRGRWRALVGLVLLVGLAGGVTLAAVAGARRTQTAYARLLRATDAPDVLVNPDQGSDSALHGGAVARLPQVAAAGRIDGLVVVPPRVTRQQDLGRFGTVLVSDGRALYTVGRPKILHGRMPDPERADEALVDPVFARQQHVSVGDRVSALLLTRRDEPWFSGERGTVEDAVAAFGRGEIGRPLTLRVAGIGVTPDAVVVDEGFELPSVALTPAFARRHADALIPYWGEIVRLRRGAADAPGFRRAVQRLAPGEAIAYQSTSVTTRKVERAVRPQVGALTVFAAVLALAGLLVAGQALVRQSALEATDHPTLHALGFARRQLFQVAMLRALIVAVGSAAIAVGLATALSPLMPIGDARTAEPHPGLSFDALVLGSGAATVVLAVLLLSAVPAWRQAGARAGTRGVTRPSRLAAAASRGGMPVPAAAGVRMALEPGRGRTAVPVRTTIVSAALAVAMVVAALVFAASLDHLVSTPRLYGWNWDLRMSVDGPDPATTGVARAALGTALDADAGVAAWSTATLGDVTLAGRSVPAIGVREGGVREGAARVVPTLVSGRLPRRADEIALGVRTLDQLGLRTGSRVAAGTTGRSRRLRVVGRVVLPGLGTYPGSDKTALGEGAVLTRATLADLGPSFDRVLFLVDLRPGADRAAVVARARRVALGVDGGSELDFASAGVQRPSDIVSYERVRTTPLVLAALLGLLALATVAHALVTAVRRRRRDFALLKTLGFTRGQVGTAVAWQATTVGVLALTIGVPLGVALGRWGWARLADDLGTLVEPVMPWAGVVVLLVAVLALVNLLAAVPGRLAGRLRPAIVLRSE